MPAHRRRLRPESTGLPPGTLAIANRCSWDCSSCGLLGTRLPSVLRDDWQGLCVAALWRRQTKAVLRHRTGVGVPQRLQRKERNLMKRKASISHDDAIIRRLRKEPDFAAEYLKAALEDEDEPRVLLIALRHLAQAQGIAKVAKAAGIERESLYRALSEHGNPRLSTLVAVTKAIGLRLTVEATSN